MAFGDKNVLEIECALEIESYWKNKLRTESNFFPSNLTKNFVPRVGLSVKSKEERTKEGSSTNDA